MLTNTDDKLTKKKKIKSNPWRSSQKAPKGKVENKVQENFVLFTQKPI